MEIVITPKDNTVGSHLKAIMDKYVEVYEKNMGKKIRSIEVNGCLLADYGDFGEVNADEDSHND